MSSPLPTRGRGQRVVTPMPNSLKGTPDTKPPTSPCNSLSDVERLRRGVLANIANIEAVELVLEELIGEASPEQLDGLMRRLRAAKAHAEEVKALFGPLDENVTNIALVRKA